MASKKRLGEVLTERQQISAEELESVLREQRASATLLGELLLKRASVPKEALIGALEEVSRFKYIDATTAQVEPAVIQLVPKAVALKYTVLPVAKEGKNRLTVAMVEPQNLRVLDELQFLTGLLINPRIGFKSEILKAIERCYGAGAREIAISQGPRPIDTSDVGDVKFITAGASERTRAAMEEFTADLKTEKAPAVRTVSAILSKAVQKGASDIHIEPHPLGAAVRIRVDGVMRELSHIPADLQASVVSRIKILSDLDIAERRNPQDGRFMCRVGSRALDFRVSTLPTHDGAEKVALRVLDPSSSRVSFTDLGMVPAEAQRLTAALKQPQGMVLVTGPTGSGKTTSIYAALHMLRSPSVHIMTVEDPIEYKVDDVNQVQVNPKAGLTFASTLRSMLRQDPNVIMVGEVRDLETAEIALKAGQTGHMVLSTLHTNDSVAAITRLVDLGVQPFVVASSISLIVAQRLVRKLCTCRKPGKMGAEHIGRFQAAGFRDVNDTMYVPEGCASCEQSGYKGRIGIYETLVVDENLRASLRDGFREDEIRKTARANGMRTMQHDALEKIHSGVTSLDEVMRVVAFEATTQPRCRPCGKMLAPSFLYCPYCGARAAHGVEGASSTP